MKIIDIDVSQQVVRNFKYGVRDFITVIHEASREYNNFTGDLYILIKYDLESLGNGGFEELKSNSIKIAILGFGNVPLISIEPKSF